MGELLITKLQISPCRVVAEVVVPFPKEHGPCSGLIRQLRDYAMWRGDVPTGRNWMELVTIKGATKRTRKPRTVTVEEFQPFIQHLDEPFGMIATLCVCFGLRISECLELKLVRR